MLLQLRNQVLCAVVVLSVIVGPARLACAAWLDKPAMAASVPRALAGYELGGAIQLALDAVAGQTTGSDSAEPEESSADQNGAESRGWLAGLWEWLKERGGWVLLILVGMFVLKRLAGHLEGRLTALVARTAVHGDPEDRENRAKTLGGVFHNVATVVIVVGGILLIVSTINPDWIVPLVGALAVVGIAVGLGTQNLIKDYFCGFVMLLENQYTVNDVVRIAGIAGLVERITLRMTVLRDLEGTVHFVPHGQIGTVTNMTHIWSRALIDVGVAYKEDVDKVMNVLMDIGKDLRQDPAFSGLILDDPEMLGVDAMADSAVVIKFFIKTRPLRQWTVKREMLRRIKKRFDELGIEIPFPHRTLYHRYEDAAPSGAPSAFQGGQP